MRDLNGVDLKVGMKVFDASLEQSCEDMLAQGLPTVKVVGQFTVLLDNGKVIYTKVQTPHRIALIVHRELCNEI